MASNATPPRRAPRSATSNDRQRPAEPGGTGDAHEDAPQNLGEVMGQVARQLQEEHGHVDATMAAITAAAVAAVPGADSCSISVVTGRQVRSRASTSELSERVDAAQSEAGEGPCLDALRERQTVRVTDYTTERRWPRFAARASALGAGSSLSFQLFVEADDLGALNLYATEPDAFDEESETVGLVFASHAAIAYSGARAEENLRAAIDKRDLIGQAKGILMERHKLTAQQAFQVLVRVSSHTNRKLFDIAEELTSTGTMPAD